MNIVSNCPLCEEHSLHIIGKDNLKTQQCINCGYVTAEKFKLNGLKKEEHQEFKNLTEDMKGWVKIENDGMWIPTIMTLQYFMLYPFNDEDCKMKWGLADMIEIPPEDRKDYDMHIHTLAIECEQLRRFGEIYYERVEDEDKQNYTNLTAGAKSRITEK